MTKKRNWGDILIWVFIVGFAYNGIASLIIDDQETLREMAAVGSVIGVLGFLGMLHTRQLHRRIDHLNRDWDVTADNFKQATEGFLERLKQAKGKDDAGK